MDEATINQVADLINNAKRPVIYAGQGIIQGEAVKELRELAASANIPVTTTLQGLGAFDEMDHRSLHMLGMCVLFFRGFLNKVVWGIHAHRMRRGRRVSIQHISPYPPCCFLIITLQHKHIFVSGMHGSAYANFAMQSADLILALGARFDDRVTGYLKLFAPEAKRAAAGTSYF